MDKQLSWHSFGPGILMASAAIGGSHLVASTQAGALYGWQLAIMIVLANVLKYPFYRFGVQYTYRTGDSLVAGYAKLSAGYLWAFFGLCTVSGVISTAAVAVLSATILRVMLPFEVGVVGLSACVIAVSWLLLVVGHYRLLDGLTKAIVVLLTLATVVAVLMAMGSDRAMASDFVPVSPWNLASLGFIIALMGWMPAPLEFSAIASLWTAKKIQEDNPSSHQGMMDFNVGYLTSSVLALLFLVLGVLVQYGTGEEIASKGTAYVGQLIQMYTTTIGSWARPLVAMIAFLCMFGTVITCIDGYARASAESLSLLKRGKPKPKVSAFTGFTALAGFGVITFFLGQMQLLLKFAMISAFLSAPVFAFINYALIKQSGSVSVAMRRLAVAGIVFLLGFGGLFLLQLLGVIG